MSGPGPDGKTYVMSQGGSLPPVEAVVGEKGIEPAPTATPGQPTPAPDRHARGPGNAGAVLDPAPLLDGLELSRNGGAG